MNAEQNIKNLNIELPKAADPVGSYVATKICGKIFSSKGPSGLIYHVTSVHATSIEADKLTSNLNSKFVHTNELNFSRIRSRILFCNRLPLFLALRGFIQ